MAVFNCHKCGAEWESDQPRAKYREECPKCSADIHCCVNCRYHDPSAHNSCTILTTEWVSDREKANLCEDFEFRGKGESASDHEKQNARNKLDQLLGTDADAPKKPTSLDDLFGE